MPFNAGIQISFELAKAFPIRSMVENGGSRLLKLARDLRMSGSDIVVEADLAEVFGRGKIIHEMEESFREVVKIQKFTYLRNDCEVSLDSGAGPTILYALRSNQHFSTVIQLSLLGWTHDRSSLARAIDQALVRRFEEGVAGASSSPGYEGIVNTLAACSSQSSAFAWSHYIHLVDLKLQESIPGYHYSPDLIKLSPAALTGAMDYLYIVQQLRDSRKITISSAMGSVTFVIWAHYILGLNVLITTEDSSTIAFGDEHTPHVLIGWSKLNPSSASILPVPHHDENKLHPSIRLLDEDMSVILDSSPDPERWTEIAVDTRYPLLGYGAAYLHRMFNANIVTDRSDPVYQESVRLIIAMAIWVSYRVDRDMHITANVAHQADVIEVSSPRRNLSIEVWRILASAELLFSKIPGATDTSAINNYVARLSKDPLDEASLPSACTTFLKRLPTKPRQAYLASRYIFRLRCLASMVLIFSFVPEIQSCSAMPLREVDFMEVGFQHYFHKACKDPEERLRLRHDTVFLEIKNYLLRSSVPANAFLYCEFGWSVFFDTFGDRDLTRVKPELIHVREGVPTNRRTMERKPFLCDGGISQNPQSLRTMDDDIQLIRGREYLPRSSATASWTDYWSTGAQAFEYSMYYRVVPKQEWRENGREPSQVFTFCKGRQAMLWETFTTTACGHISDDSEGPSKLGMDAAAVVGWITDQSKFEEIPERFLICLTKGEPEIRWLAANTSVFLGRRCEAIDIPTRPEARVREVMLRTEDCCASCLLEQAAAVPGNHYWILIL